MSYIKSITTQEINKHEIELRFSFTNNWHHVMEFSKLDDRKRIAGKLLVLANDILYNENLDAPGLPDDASAIDPEFFRG